MYNLNSVLFFHFCRWIYWPWSFVHRHNAGIDLLKIDLHECNFCNNDQIPWHNWSHNDIIWWYLQLEDECTITYSDVDIIILMPSKFWPYKVRPNNPKTNQTIRYVSLELTRTMSPKHRLGHNNPIFSSTWIALRNFGLGQI